MFNFAIGDTGAATSFQAYVNAVSDYCLKRWIDSHSTGPPSQPQKRLCQVCDILVGYSERPERLIVIMTRGGVV